MTREQQHVTCLWLMVDSIAAIVGGFVMFLSAPGLFAAWYLAFIVLVCAVFLTALLVLGLELDLLDHEIYESERIERTDIYLNSPPVPQWMVEQAQRWRALEKAGVIVKVPMSEAERLPDPDYGL